MGKNICQENGYEDRSDYYERSNINIKFKPLAWRNTGYGDHQEANISIGYPVMYYLYRIGSDNSGNVFAICLTDSMFKLEKTDLLTIENAKTVVEREYQKTMNMFYNEFQKQII